MSKPDIATVTIDAIRARHADLAVDIVRTPSVRLISPLMDRLLEGGEVWLKLECFQHTGTFKARGALSVTRSIVEDRRSSGITAASAGNHAIAAAWAARREKMSAKVVMLSLADPFRVARAEAEGAEVILKEGGPAIFAEAERLVREEGRTFIHPFEGIDTFLGAAGVGLELIEDVPDLDAVIVSVGGGGLIGGLAAAVKALKPACQVYGVEPVGADNMSRSRTAGEPVTLDQVDTVADSLGPPMALPFGYALNKAYVDDVVTETDDDICAGMVVMQEEAKLAVEPAAGAVMAGLLSSLRVRLKGKRIGLIVCGANIGAESYRRLIKRGHENITGLVK